MHEDNVQVFTVIASRRVVKGLVITREGKEPMSEFLGTDVAAGPSGMRWWNNTRNRQGMGFYGCVVTKGADGKGEQEVHKPEEVAYGDITKELPPASVKEQTKVEPMKEAELVPDFDSWSEAKLDAYAVLYEVQSYPSSGGEDAKRARLKGDYPDLAAPDLPTEMEKFDRELAAMKGAELDKYARDHNIPDYDKNARVAVRRGLIAIHVQQS